MAHSSFIVKFSRGKFKASCLGYDTSKRLDHRTNDMPVRTLINDIHNSPDAAEGVNSVETKGVNRSATVLIRATRQVLKAKDTSCV